MKTVIMNSMQTDQHPENNQEDWTLLNDLKPLWNNVKAGASTGVIVGILMLLIYWGAAIKTATSVIWITVQRRFGITTIPKDIPISSFDWSKSLEILLILFGFCLIMSILFAILTVQSSLWFGKQYKGNEWRHSWHIVGGILGGFVAGVITATSAGWLFASYCMDRVDLGMFAFVVGAGPYLFLALTPAISYSGRSRQTLVRPIVLALLPQALLTIIAVFIFTYASTLTDWLINYLSCHKVNLLEHTAVVGAIAGSLIGLSMGLMLHLWRYRAQIEDYIIGRTTQPKYKTNKSSGSLTKKIIQYRQKFERSWYGAVIGWMLDVLIQGIFLFISISLLRWLINRSWTDFTGIVFLLYIAWKIFREFKRPDLDALMTHNFDPKNNRTTNHTFSDRQNARRIQKFLESILLLFTNKGQTQTRLLEIEYDIDKLHPLLIISDLHRGAGNQADDFQKCYFVYKSRLQQLLDENDKINPKTQLILLGDVEELWEEDFDDIYQTYRDLYMLETQLVKEKRCYRIWGNHDIDFQYPLSKASVALRTLYQKNGIKIEEGDPDGMKEFVDIYEAIKINVCKAGEKLGVLYLVHGHQGTPDSDIWGFTSRWFVRSVWRWAQNTIWLSRNTPSQSIKLGNWHDNTMRNWAYSWNTENQKQGKEDTPLILVTGHTHNLLAPDQSDPKTSAYFNSGCCAYTDGMITGIEIEYDTIRLRRWKSKQTIDPTGIELDDSIKYKSKLSELFTTLKSLHD